MALEQDPGVHRRGRRRRRAAGAAGPSDREQGERADERDDGRTDRRATGTRRLQRAAAGCGPSIDVPAPRKVALARTVARHDAEPDGGGAARLSYDARPQRTPSGGLPAIARQSRPIALAYRIVPREPVPQIRPFRALRYAPDAVGDLAAVVAPPYDVIGAGRAAPPARPRTRRTSSASTRRRTSSATPSDERYRRAARTLAAWRSDGTFHKDPRPAIYVYEQTYRVPGHGRRADPARASSPACGWSRFGPGSGVLPHERTLAAPREDRYRLLRATGVNTSPVVGLYDDPTGPRGSDPRDARRRARRRSTSVDDDGVRHRLWVVEADGPPRPTVGELIAIAAAPSRSRSPTATTATRRPSATATSGG